MSSEFIRAVIVLAACVLPASGVALNRNSQMMESNPPVSYKLKVLRVFPHEGGPFTQGLEITADGKHLVETSGAYPPGTASYVRIVDPITGSTINSLQAGLTGKFAEGIVQLPDSKHWFASTYNDMQAVEYTPDLQFVKHHNFPWQGWGLTRSHDGRSFLATNGSEHVMTLRRGDFALTDVRTVTCMGKPITGLNELEMVDNFMGLGPTLLGNVYLSRLVLALDPVTAQCKGVFHLEGLGMTESDESSGFHAANGIAYNKSSGTLIVTGKNWNDMFEVRPELDSDNEAISMLSTFASRPMIAMLATTDTHLEVSAAADSFRDQDSKSH